MYDAVSLVAFSLNELYRTSRDTDIMVNFRGECYQDMESYKNWTLGVEIYKKFTTVGITKLLLYHDQGQLIRLIIHPSTPSESDLYNIITSFIYIYSYLTPTTDQVYRNNRPQSDVAEPPPGPGHLQIQCGEL